MGCGDLSHSAHHWRPQDYTKISSAPHFAMRRLESYGPGRRLCLLSPEYYVAGAHAESK